MSKKYLRFDLLTFHRETRGMNNVEIGIWAKLKICHFENDGKLPDDVAKVLGIRGATKLGYLKEQLDQFYPEYVQHKGAVSDDNRVQA